MKPDNGRGQMTRIDSPFFLWTSGSKNKLVERRWCTHLWRFVSLSRKFLLIFKNLLIFFFSRGEVAVVAIIISLSLSFSEDIRRPVQIHEIVEYFVARDADLSAHVNLLVDRL